MGTFNKFMVMIFMLMCLSCTKSPTALPADVLLHQDDDVPVMQVPVDCTLVVAASDVTVTE